MDTQCDDRVNTAFIEAIRRTAHAVFAKEEIIISNKIKKGDPMIFTMEAKRDNGDPIQVNGQAYIYPDLIIVCVESVTHDSMETIYPHSYEYLCC